MANSVSIAINPTLRERSLRAGMTQALWWAVMFGAGECSFSLFAAYIKAPAYFFGLMAGVPALLGPLMQVAGANTLDRVRNRRFLLVYFVFFQAACYVPLAALPFLRQNTLAYAVFCAVLACYYSVGNFPAPAWNAWISVLVPSAQRCDYFSRQLRGTATVTLLTKLTMAGSLFWASQQEKLNPATQCAAYVFAIAFMLSGVARFLSWHHLRRMHEPAYAATPDAAFTFWQFIARARESNFVHFVLFVSAMYFGIFISAPFFVPYVVYKLHFAYWQWIVIDSSAALASVLTFHLWGRFSVRYGNKATMVCTAYGIALVPLLWLLSRNFYSLIVINSLSGAVWGGFGLASFNYIIEAAVPAKRARCTAYFAIFIGVASFVGSMAGTWLEHVIPPAVWSAEPTSNFAYLLAISAGIRLLANLITLPTFKELGEVQPLQLRKWFFFITEARLPVGLRFGAITGDGQDDEDEDEA